MKKSDLKTGMLVKQRSGDWSMVMINSLDGDILIDIEGYSSDQLSNYDNESFENRFGNELLDIVKIARLRTVTLVAHMIYHHDTPESSGGYTVLWEKDNIRKDVLENEILVLSSMIDQHNFAIDTLNNEIHTLREELNRL